MKATQVNFTSHARRLCKVSICDECLRPRAPLRCVCGGNIAWDASFADDGYWLERTIVRAS